MDVGRRLLANRAGSQVGVARRVYHVYASRSGLDPSAPLLRLLINNSIA